MRRRNLLNRKLQLCLTILIITLAALALAACGSSSGGSSSSQVQEDQTTPPPAAPTPAVQTVSGVAATGAAIVGEVTLKDSSSPANIQGPDRISPDGNFSFDVTGLTPPFYIKAVEDITGNEFYSVSMSTGIGNINPLTNIAVAAAASVSDPADAFNDPASYPISQVALDQALSDLRDFLLPVLTAYSADINPLTDPFVADGTGLDAVLDDVNIDISTPGMVTLTDDLGIQLGQIADDFQTVFDDLSEVAAPLVLRVSGDGVIYSGPYLADLDLTIDDSSLSTSELSYSFRHTSISNLLPLANASITEVTAEGGTVNIEGTCVLEGIDYTFTVYVNNSPNEMGMKILDSSGVVHPDSVDSQPLSNGDGFTITIESTLPSI